MAEEGPKAVWTTEWKDYKKWAETAFDRYVSKSSELVRQMSLTGIAVVWIFRETTKDGAISVAPHLRWAAIFFVVALVIDLAHYVYGTFNTNATLDRLRDEERDAVAKGNAWPHDPKDPPPDVTEGGVKAMFCLKTASTVVGAGLLLYYLGTRI